MFWIVTLVFAVAARRRCIRFHLCKPFILPLFSLAPRQTPGSPPNFINKTPAHQSGFDNPPFYFFYTLQQPKCLFPRSFKRFSRVVKIGKKSPIAIITRLYFWKVQQKKTVQAFLSVYVQAFQCATKVRKGASYVFLLTNMFLTSV